MNAENVLKVADAIEQHSIADLGFNMGNFIGPADATHPDLSGHKCGTVACVAGWSYAVRNGTGAPEHIFVDDFDWEVEGEWFGLGRDTAHDLFYGYGDHRAVGPAQAVKTLRHLAATGEVDWSA